MQKAALACSEGRQCEELCPIIHGEADEGLLEGRWARHRHRLPATSASASRSRARAKHDIAASSAHRTCGPPVLTCPTRLG